jgi:hypothetical protein
VRSVPIRHGASGKFRFSDGVGWIERRIDLR